MKISSLDGSTTNGATSSYDDKIKSGVEARDNSPSRKRKITLDA